MEENGTQYKKGNNYFLTKQSEKSRKRPKRKEERTQKFYLASLPFFVEQFLVPLLKIFLVNET